MKTSLSSPSFARPSDGATALPPAPIAFALATFVVLLWPMALLNDPDTLWHLEAGEWMIENRAIAIVDPFSHSFAGQPWTMHEWLSELVMTAVDRAWGSSGLLALAAAAAAASVYILTRHAARRLGGLPLFLLVFLSFSLVGPHLLVRPHLIVLPVLCFWISEILRAREEQRAPGFWLLPAMTLWANAHGSFVLGLCMIGPLAVEAILDARADARIKVFRSWAAFGVASVIAAMLTPHGPAGLLFPFTLMSMDGNEVINEWKPADFGTVTPLTIALIGGLFALLRIGVQVPAIRLAMLLMFLFMALKHQRHEAVLGVFAVLVLAEPIARALQGGDRPPERSATAPPSSRAAAACIVIAAAAFLLRISIPVGEITTPMTPHAALASVPQEIRGTPVLNDYDVGGFLISEKVRPFIDGRADLYGDDFLKRHTAMMRGDRDLLRAAISDYGIKWTLLRAGGPAAAVMEDEPGWVLWHEGRDFVVHVKMAAGGGSV